MGFIGFIKSLSNVLSSDVDKPQEHQEKDFWKCQESNPGLLGEKQLCFLSYAAPYFILIVKTCVFGVLV